MNASVSPTADSRRLVLGAAVGFGVEDVRVFAESLRGAGYGGDVALIVRWPGGALTRDLARHRIEALPIVHLRSASRSVHARRYGIYARYLRPRAERYDDVMLSDVRDVVFQRHPFDGIAGERCHFFLEGATQTVGTEPTNWRWAQGCLTPAQALALAPHRISCSGITIGGTAAMLAYLDRMAALVAAVPWRIYRRIGHGYDQALHNVLVHLTPELASTVVDNNRHVATMGLEPPATYEIDAAGLIRTADGHLSAVCHQYDRIAATQAAVSARFAAKA